MNPSADWQAFLAALRAEGVPIGAGELIRLQQVFERAPRLDRQGLQQVLASLEKVGIELGPGNYLTVDRVSRTSMTALYLPPRPPLALISSMQNLRPA